MAQPLVEVSGDNCSNAAAELQALLKEANEKLARCRCGASSNASTYLVVSERPSNSSYNTTGSMTPATILSVSQEHSPVTVDLRRGAISIALSSPDPMISAPPPIDAFLLPPSPWNTSGPPPVPNLSLYFDPISVEDISSNTFDVCPASWPLNIPPPMVLYHLVEIFFNSVPLASRLIHKPTFMVKLRQVPTSPEFPHVALLHAICGLASLYSPIITDTKRPPKNPHWNSGSEFNSAIVFRPNAREGVQGKHYFPKSLKDIMDIGEEGFGAAHIRWAAASMRLAVREGDRLLQVLQAAIVCTWYTYSTGMRIAVYTWMGSVTRLLGPLGFYASEGFEPLSRLPSNMLFLSGNPRNHIEAEAVRQVNAFWVTYVMERIYNAGTAWPLTITDEDISQMMPCRYTDFVAGERVPTHGRQRLFTENMLLSHPPLTTDSWTLYIKATILISRVRSFNCRYRISTTSTKDPVSAAALRTEGTGVSPTESEEFRHLDQTIATFVRDMPRAYRDPVGTTVDPLLYMAHLLPHVAMIQLHDPHAQLHSPNDYSATQMLAATRAILELIYKVCGTTFDLLYMDHGCSFGWFVAGAAVIRFLRVKMDAKDEDEVARLEQELGVVHVEKLGGPNRHWTLAIDVEGGNLNGSDGSLPCEPCRRAHAYEVMTRPAAAPAEPTCEYDHPEIVAEGPKVRIARLESQIAELQALLGEANEKLARCRCGASANASTYLAVSEGPSNSSYNTTGSMTPATILGVSQEHSPATGDLRSGAISVALPSPDPMISAPPPLDAFLLPPSPWNTSGPPPVPNLSLYFDPISVEDISSNTFDVCPASWPLNIPPPMVLYHLVEIFFNSVPLASRLIHKPTFMVKLRQVPTSPEFPHVALLHAICGLASLYSPIIADTKMDSKTPHWNPHWNSGPEFNSAIVFRPYAREGVQGKHYFPKSLKDIMDIGEEGFGAAHIRWAAASMRLALREGDRLLQLLQAAIVCTWYTYSMGMRIAVYSWVGSVTKLLVPLGFYASEGFEPLSRLPSNMMFLYGNPKNHIEAETIRNAFWVTYVMERIYNAGNAWPLTITDEDISQMMPCRYTDFVAGERVPTHGRQRLFTENMLLSHPPLTTDSWTLYIKATILISRVRSFNCRYRISTTSTKDPVSGAALSTEGTGVSPTESEEFRHLDQTIATFVRDMPRAYRNPVGTTVDPLLYMAHLLPHVAMIQLHDPHAQLNSSNDYSATQMLAATRAILELIYKVCGTTFDLLYMDHGCSFCWFVAGAAVIRFLRVKMDAKDEDEVARLEQELMRLNARFMLKNLGDRTAIGLVQAKLLEEIYNVELKGCGRNAPSAPDQTY
ncbi:hypothetical protein FRC05_004575 [Tulasnella sp. 425]|nr:hypothetical protein FRC05_004575 [Tulasnella sp. 425]